MFVVADSTSRGITEFEFSDGSVAHAVQDHSRSGAPLTVKGDMSFSQIQSVQTWTGCRVYSTKPSKG
jgi:hypothetical protein